MKNKITIGRLSYEYLDSHYERHGAPKTYAYAVERVDDQQIKTSGWFLYHAPPSMLSLNVDRFVEAANNFLDEEEKRAEEEVKPYVEPLILVPEGESQPNFWERMGINFSS